MAEKLLKFVLKVFACMLIIGGLICVIVPFFGTNNWLYEFLVIMFIGCVGMIFIGLGAILFKFKW